MYDIVIIGAGTAGMTAAIYAARANKKVLILEESNYGGQIINSTDIENYPGFTKISGFDFATNLYEQMKKTGVEVAFEKVLSLKDSETIITSKREIRTKSIIIAVGLRHRMLGLYGEKELIGSGISYCATCDGNFFKNMNVAIVGGGNTAIEDALYLANICKKVSVIHRRENFSADTYLVDELKLKDNINFHMNSSVTKIKGNDKLESIEVCNVITNEYQNIEIDGLFVAIGFIPDNHIFSQVVTLDEYGYIISNENGTTKSSNIFVAGDCRKKELRQLTTAVGDGANAASSAIKYLNTLK